MEYRSHFHPPRQFSPPRFVTVIVMIFHYARDYSSAAPRLPFPNGFHLIMMIRGTVMCSKCDTVEEKFGWQATLEAFLDGFVRPLVVEKKRRNYIKLSSTNRSFDPHKISRK